MDCSLDHEDMVMVNSVNSMVLSRSKREEDEHSDSSGNSNDSAIAVLYKSNDPPFYSEELSFSSLCSRDGSPLEQREDIMETKRIPGRLKDVLNFNDEDKLHEVEEQMKARENIDRDMEKAIDRIKNMVVNDKLEDTTLLEAADIAREKAIEVRAVAKEGKTTLKRAMEIIEVALPPFLIACEKSYEKNDLSEQVEQECQNYETCMLEKINAALDYELGQTKSIQAHHHLDNCIGIAKEDEKMMSEKLRNELDCHRVQDFTDAKKEMDDIIKSELDEVHSCIRSCKGDLENIDGIIGEQEKRFNVATKAYDMTDKSLNVKICANRKNQDDLRAQLEKLMKQETSLVERRKFEQQVQERAKEWNWKVCDQLTELKKSVSDIQTCAMTSLKVMELMKEGGSKLLRASIKAEEQYLNHLRDLDIEAKTKWRTGLATSAVEKMLSIDFAATNCEEYRERYKELKVELNKAVQRQQRLNAERLKKEMKEYKEEMKQEEKKKKEAETSLNVLLETICQCDEQLRQLGRTVDPVNTMYEWRKQEMASASASEFASIEFSADEDSEDDS